MLKENVHAEVLVERLNEMGVATAVVSNGDSRIRKLGSTFFQWAPGNNHLISRFCDSRLGVSFVPLSDCPQRGRRDREALSRNIRTYSGPLHEKRNRS